MIGSEDDHSKQAKEILFPYLGALALDQRANDTQNHHKGNRIPLPSSRKSQLRESIAINKNQLENIRCKLLIL